MEPGQVMIGGRLEQIGPSREELRERFKKVILLAGYKNPEPILQEWFDEYMKNVPDFIKMLEEYEEKYK
jgi:hypothetical protein